MDFFSLEVQSRPLKLVFIFLLLVGSGFVQVSEARYLYSKGFNVLSYGAVGDGDHDDTEAFEKAWKDVCATQDGILEVPIGHTFLVNPITFSGLCKGRTNFQLDGEIKAPKSMDAWKDKGLNWIVFEEMSNLIVSGKGTFNGQGQNWWSCKQKKKCKRAPTAVLFSKCDDCTITGVKFVDSQQKHFVFSDSNNGLVDSITIEAPPDSPNTDGIHLNVCTNMIIRNSNVKTGDDCVSIGKKNSNIKINNMYCGVGCHGISIGSLGKDHGEVERVTDVEVSNSVLEETTNGLRIKTWAVCLN
ncbi:hypothetical protein M758_12G064200 [Ceratodon purpureus]|nr:hypothetical protein M758_12G064200 [Ceratodon purpureus]